MNSKIRIIWRGFLLSFLVWSWVGQHRTLAEENLDGISLLKVAPRVITPNSDARNDKTFFYFSDTVRGLPLDTGVYDLSGAKISTLTIAIDDETALCWDGQDSAGRVAPSGIYIYQIKLGKKVASGTVVIAK